MTDAIPKPLTKTQDALLNDLYFKSRVIFSVGRDRIYKYLQEHHEKAAITRRQVAAWLKDNEVNQLFRKREPVKDLQKTIVSAPHKVVEIDLIDMSSKPSGKYDWILNGIDVFSKKAYSIPLTDKSEPVVLAGFKKMLKQMIKKPSAIRSDNGSEFVNDGFVDFAEKEGITLINGKPHTPQSQANIERFNGILKRILEMYRVQFNEQQWIKYLDKVVKTYNTTWQRTINNTPEEVDSGNTDNKEIKTNIEEAVNPKNDTETEQKFIIGDKVRILLEKPDGIGGKSFRNWSDEIYMVRKVYIPKANSVYTYSYQLINPDDEEVKDKFYQSELQLVSSVNNNVKEPKKFKVSSLVKAVMVKQGNNWVKSFEVKWVGYRKKSDNTIEPRDTLMEDVPKMVAAYELEHKVVWGNGKVSQTN